MSASFPDFSAFAEELHGRTPFPWQAALADRLLAHRRWPTEIGVATGLGKTTCLDIAVWWLASEARLDPSERIAPTRLWWLVNRRLLVDSTAAHAERLATKLADAHGGSVRAVADSLRCLSAAPESPPLQVVRLRGGVAVERPLDPSQPVVILSTIPMYGSRLLFRGYGSSRSMRPIDAALAGTDSLVLVDEAHLAHHLMALHGPLADCDQLHDAVLPNPRLRPVVVSLTATGSAPTDDRFDLGADDLVHPEVVRRLDAAKPMRVVELPAGSPTDRELAARAMAATRRGPEPTSCVVFANTPRTARDVAARLRKEADGGEIDVLVLTGRQRDREAQVARERLLDPSAGVPAVVEHHPRMRSLVVVATQTLEVGADVDFEHLVTEACGVRSLIQRLGRVNRLGRYSHATATYVHAEPKARGTEVPSWPVYGSEPIAVMQRLRLAMDSEGVTDVRPRSLNSLLGTPSDDPGRAPEVMPALLWEWVKTTTPPLGEAPVEPYFSGLADLERRVSVCWRAFVPTDSLSATDGPFGLWPRIRSDELIELSLTDTTDALKGRRVARLTAERSTVEHVDAALLRPGDTVVLRCVDGLLDADGWSQDAKDVVADAALLHHGLPLDAEAFSALVGDPPLGPLRCLLDGEDDEERAVHLADLVASLSELEPLAWTQDEWIGLLNDLDVGAGIVESPGEVPRLAVRHPRSSSRNDDLDELSTAAPLSTAIGLAAHGDGVGARAAAVAERIGVAPEVVPTVVQAARFHDVGKADPRFQRWLAPRGADQLVAKSREPRPRWQAQRIASGWPAGGRHEALSARLVQAWLDQVDDAIRPVLDHDLLIHLVVSHHGHARPLLLPVEDAGATRIAVDFDAQQLDVDGCLAEIDWDQPARFRRLNQRFGHWGLALLEAVVRQSDHAVSGGGWAGGADAEGNDLIEASGGLAEGVE